MSEQNSQDILLNTLSRERWQSISSIRRAGILVPLFSVYSKKSLGIADTNDLKLLIDFSQRSGNSILQLLPLNEMGAVFCPYDSLSSFALEPAYIHLESLLDTDKKSFKEEINELRQLFMPLKSHLDYRIKQEKLHLLWDIFMQRKDTDAQAIKRFKEENSYWLEDFALFKVLKDFHQGIPWYEWVERYKNRDKDSLEKFRKEHAEEVEFQVWIQWQLYRQFKEVKDYAEDKKVMIKGDLPILVSRDSADVWQHREFFKLDFAAGAPPDMYCAKGQRWGMPPYHWQNIAADNFRYLKEKLKYAENFYQILRIDHVVGLFRIWSIPYNEPKENQGLNGFFDPQDESRWFEQGKMILSNMVNSTNMLLCAEDLGVIPKVCPDTLKELGIPGNDVQRWVKDWDIKHDFLPAESYRLLSVAMLSTHDTTNWSAWWRYEAGTVDEALFVRKCSQHGIDYTIVRDRLFDLDLSYHGRLRWLNSIASSTVLVNILGKPKEELGDFIGLYENTFHEKEKLWQLLKMVGKMEEEVNSELIKRVLQFTLDSNSIFCIQLITDWLYMADIFKADPYQYRINTPGVISEKNWSMVVPVPLEELMKHKVCGEMKKMILKSGRI